MVARHGTLPEEEPHPGSATGRQSAPARGAEAACAERSEQDYSWAMAKDQDKKRTAKTNKPKLTAKEKKAKKLAKKAK